MLSMGSATAGLPSSLSKASSVDAMNGNFLLYCKVQYPHAHPLYGQGSVRSMELKEDLWSFSSAVVRWLDRDAEELDGISEDKANGFRPCCRQKTYSLAHDLWQRASRTSYPTLNALPLVGQWQDHSWSGCLPGWFMGRACCDSPPLQISL